MKKIIVTAVAATMLISVCGCGTAKEEKSNIKDRLSVVSTTPPEDAASATETPDETIPPMEETGTVTTVDATEVLTSQSEDEFEETEVDGGYVRYVGGNDEWGIILPPDTQVGDESEDGSLFIVNSNVITAIIIDKVTTLTTVDEVKDYYSSLGEIKIDDFTVIRDNDEYIGCFFEYLTEDNVRGFAKYVTDGKQTVCATGINSTANAAEDVVMREVVNSLVMFE